MWLWDLKTPEEEYLSPGFWKFSGYDPEEMPHKSRSWQGLIFEEDLKTAEVNLDNVLKEPDFIHYDQNVRYRHKGEHVVWVRSRGKVILDEQGKPAYLFGAHNDITH